MTTARLCGCTRVGWVMETRNRQMAFKRTRRARPATASSARTKLPRGLQRECSARRLRREACKGSALEATAWRARVALWVSTGWPLAPATQDLFMAVLLAFGGIRTLRMKPESLEQRISTPPASSSTRVALALRSSSEILGAEEDATAVMSRSSKHEARAPANGARSTAAAL